jgi:hypothetical protein
MAPFYPAAGWLPLFFSSFSNCFHSYFLRVSLDKAKRNQTTTVTRMHPPTARTFCLPHPRHLKHAPVVRRARGNRWLIAYLFFFCCLFLYHNDVVKAETGHVVSPCRSSCISRRLFCSVTCWTCHRSIFHHCCVNLGSSCSEARVVAQSFDFVWDVLFTMYHSLLHIEPIAALFTGFKV